MRQSVLKQLENNNSFLVILLYNLMYYNAIVHGYIPVFNIPALPPYITGIGIYIHIYMLYKVLLTFSCFLLVTRIPHLC